MIRIQSNGSRFAGEAPASIEELIEALGSNTLDPTFENYGNFIDPNPISAATGKPLYSEGTVYFFGNFYELSHVFGIVTDEPEIIEKLSAAIRANQQTADYQNARRAIAERKIQAKRERERHVRKDNEEYERRELGRLQAKYARRAS